jgi:hypothetical protein
LKTTSTSTATRAAPRLKTKTIRARKAPRQSARQHHYSADAGTLVRTGISDKRVQAQFGRYVHPEDFLKKLAHTPAQAMVLHALEKNDEFQTLWRWLEDFPGGNPVRFAIQPGLIMDRKERYGGFMGDSLTLVINPSKPEHVENPQMLVDTVVHELVHAVLDVMEESERQELKIPRRPIPQRATDLFHDAHLQALAPNADEFKASVKRKPEARTYLQRAYGSGDSDPVKEFIDVNRATQHFVQRIIDDAFRRTGIGEPHFRDSAAWRKIHG